MGINIRFNIRGVLSVGGAFKIAELVKLYFYLQSSIYSNFLFMFFSMSQYRPYVSPLSINFRSCSGFPRLSISWQRFAPLCRPCPGSPIYPVWNLLFILCNILISFILSYLYTQASTYPLRILSCILLKGQCQDYVNFVCLWTSSSHVSGIPEWFWIFKEIYKVLCILSRLPGVPTPGSRSEWVKSENFFTPESLLSNQYLTLTAWLLRNCSIKSIGRPWSLD